MIDENELHRLSLLLEDMFPEAVHYMVTVVIKPNGNVSARLSNVEEYALFSFFGDASTECRGLDDLLTEPADKGNRPIKPESVTWQPTRKSGTNSTPAARRGLCYPVGFDANWNIVGTGETVSKRTDTRNLSDLAINDWQPPDEEPHHIIPDANHLLWPRNGDGDLARWVLEPDTLKERAAQRAIRLNESRSTLEHLSEPQLNKLRTGEIRISSEDQGKGPLNLEPILDMRPIRTVWRRKRHNAGSYGTKLVRNLLGEKLFDNPKSLYCTLDAVATAIGNRTDAVILDFFAGSGTTLHAVTALNAADGGNRQCILVTNNEVGYKQTHLRKAGHRPGDAEWERVGVFQQVTRPRVEAALTGRTPAGDPVKGKYLPPLYDRPLSDGLPASAAFLKLRCLHPDHLAAGDIFDELHPLLWAAAGGIGPCPTEPIPRDILEDPGWLLPGDGVIPDGCRYGVLLRGGRLTGFCRKLAEGPTVTHVWMQALSDGAVADSAVSIREAAGSHVQVVRLYRDVLSHFQVATGNKA